MASYQPSGICSTASPSRSAPFRMRPTRFFSMPVTWETYSSSPNRVSALKMSARSASS